MFKKRTNKRNIKLKEQYEEDDNEDLPAVQIPIHQKIQKKKNFLTSTSSLSKTKPKLSLTEEIMETAEPATQIHSKEEIERIKKQKLFKKQFEHLKEDPLIQQEEENFISFKDENDSQDEKEQLILSDSESEEEETLMDVKKQLEKEKKKFKEEFDMPADEDDEQEPAELSETELEWERQQLKKVLNIKQQPLVLQPEKKVSHELMSCQSCMRPLEEQIEQLSLQNDQLEQNSLLLNQQIENFNQQQKRAEQQHQLESHKYNFYKEWSVDLKSFLDWHQQRLKELTEWEEVILDEDAFPLWLRLRALLYPPADSNDFPLSHDLIENEPITEKEEEDSFDYIEKIIRHFHDCLLNFPVDFQDAFFLEGTMICLQPWIQFELLESLLSVRAGKPPTRTKIEDYKWFKLLRDWPTTSDIPSEQKNEREINQQEALKQCCDWTVKNIFEPLLLRIFRDRPVAPDYRKFISQLSLPSDFLNQLNQ